MDALTLYFARMMAQGEAATAKALMETADFLSTKDLKWYFSAMLILLVASGLWIIKGMHAQSSKYVSSMEAQLSEQRAANKELNAQYMHSVMTDHRALIEMQVKSIDAQNRTSESQNRLVDAVTELSSLIREQRGKL
jgi:hypothetical protein